MPLYVFLSMPQAEIAVVEVVIAKVEAIPLIFCTLCNILRRRTSISHGRSTRWGKEGRDIACHKQEVGVQRQ